MLSQGIACLMFFYTIYNLPLWHNEKWHSGFHLKIIYFPPIGIPSLVYQLPPWRVQKYLR